MFSSGKSNNKSVKYSFFLVILGLTCSRSAHVRYSLPFMYIVLKICFLERVLSLILNYDYIRVMNQYRKLKQIISERYDDGEASAIALMLLEDIAGIDRVGALTGSCVSEDIEERLLSAARRVAQGEPVQYVTGKVVFCGLTLDVMEGVLIPRPETEELVDWILCDVKCCPNICEVCVLDIGTGSGCIAVSLSKALGNAVVEAWDISDRALEIAKHNSDRHEAGVVFRKKDILKVVADEVGKYDVIVSNPPYICNRESADMSDNVLSYEPHLALFVPDDEPLLFYEKIADYASQSLKDGGQLYFEINRLFGDSVVAMLEQKGYVDVELRKDQFGNDRMVKARVGVR